MSPTLRWRMHPADRSLLWVLALGFAVRLFHSDAPLLGTNSWRQCDNAAIARNYALLGYRFHRPEVDWNGHGPAVVQMEFPGYPYAVALLYGLFGIRDWLGRWLSIGCSLLTIVAMFSLARRTVGDRAAVWAGFFLAVLPLHAYYGRAFMVEAMMLLGLAVGVLMFDRWVEGGSRAAFWASASATALACLLKIVSLYVGLPLLWLAWRRHGSAALRRPALWGYAALVLAPVAAWYAYSGRLLEESGLSLMGDWRYGTDKWGTWSLVGTWEFWNRVLFRRIAEKHLTWFGFAAFLIGFGLRRHGPREGVFAAWLAGLLVYTAVVSRGAYHYELYQLPFVLPMAVYMGKAYAWGFRKRFWKAWSAAVLAPLLVLAAGASLWRYAQISSLEDPEDSSTWRLADLIRTHTEPDALVAAIDGHDPTVLYHARRRGWIGAVEDLEWAGPGWARGMAVRGARYLAASHEDFVDPARTTLVRTLQRRYRVVVDDGANFILKLSP